MVIKLKYSQKEIENTDFTFCVRGKRKLKKYGRSADNEGITDVSALGVIKDWMETQEKNRP